MQKSFHVQPYPLWAVWMESSKVRRSGRVIGWVALSAEHVDGRADDHAADDYTYPVVHDSESGWTENLSGVDYDLYGTSEEASVENGSAEAGIAAGAPGGR